MFELRYLTLSFERNTRKQIEEEVEIIVPHMWLLFSYLDWEIAQLFAPPPPAVRLSCSCKTPRFINPNVMKTTAVVLGNSIII